MGEFSKRQGEYLGAIKERMSMFELIKGISEKIDQLGQGQPRIAGILPKNLPKAESRSDQSRDPAIAQKNDKVFANLQRATSEIMPDDGFAIEDRGGANLEKNIMRNVEVLIGGMFNKLESKLGGKLDTMYSGVLRNNFVGEKNGDGKNLDTSEGKTVRNFNHELGMFDVKLERLVANLDIIKNMPHSNYNDVENYENRLKQDRSNILDQHMDFKTQQMDLLNQRQLLTKKEFRRLVDLSRNDSETSSADEDLYQRAIYKMKKQKQNQIRKQKPSHLEVPANGSSSNPKLKNHTKHSENSSERLDKFTDQSVQLQENIGSGFQKSKNNNHGYLMDKSIDKDDSIDSPEKMESILKNRANYNRSVMELDSNVNFSETFRSVCTDYISNEETCNDISWDQKSLQTIFPDDNEKNQNNSN